MKIDENFPLMMFSNLNSEINIMYWYSIDHVVAFQHISRPSLNNYTVSRYGNQPRGTYLIGTLK